MSLPPSSGNGVPLPHGTVIMQYICGRCCFLKHDVCLWQQLMSHCAAPWTWDGVNHIVGSSRRVRPMLLCFSEQTRTRKGLCNCCRVLDLQHNWAEAISFAEKADHGSSNNEFDTCSSFDPVRTVSLEWHACGRPRCPSAASFSHFGAVRDSANAPTFRTPKVATLGASGGVSVGAPTLVFAEWPVW